MIATLLRKLTGAALTALAASAYAQAPAPAPAPVTPPAPLDIEDEAARLMWWGDFEALERLYVDVNRPGRYTARGSVLVHDVRRGTARSLDTPRGTGEAFMVEVDALTLSWAQQWPQSPQAQWLRAQALVTRAWEVRGSGFAKTVTPQAWADFQRLLESAVQHLASTSQVSLQDSSAYRVLIQAGRGLSWDVNRLEQLVAAGLQRNPEDISLWYQLLTSSLPKWGGSRVAVDRLIRRAADHHKERGDEIYARLYHAAAEEDFSHAVFKDTAADWVRIRKGLHDAIARWPAKAVFWNQLGYFACLKDDRDTLAQALDSIDNQPDLDQWGSNARRFFESCQKLSRQG